MRNRSQWPTVAVLFVVLFASGCADSPNDEPAATSSNGSAANVQSVPLV